VVQFGHEPHVPGVAGNPARGPQGAAHDITLASLRIEHMFAADDATRAVIRSQVS